jgi:predicted dithiol-disulfide oxidoreductase (DUF899 family)
MTEHMVGTREEWLQARKELLKEEKEVIRRSGELTAEYNFEPVDFDKIVAEFGQSESIVEAAASCGTDLEGYVTSEGPGLTAFALEDGVVYHTYTAYAPESDFIVGSQQILDRAPREPSAGFPILRRDELEDAAAGTTAS